MSSILIPVQGSAEVVEVLVDDLPQEALDVIDILQAEMAPLDLWLRFAVEYYRHGKPEDFRAILAPLEDLALQPATNPGAFGNQVKPQNEWGAVAILS